MSHNLLIPSPPISTPANMPLLNWRMQDIDMHCIVAVNAHVDSKRLLELTKSGELTGDYWDLSYDTLHDKIHDGEITYLPKGTTLTITQE